MLKLIQEFSAALNIESLPSPGILQKSYRDYVSKTMDSSDDVGSSESVTSGRHLTESVPNIQTSPTTQDLHLKN